MINLKLLLFVVIINSISVYGGCPSNFFDCGNERCIAQFWRCDGEDDCGNWADEQQCHNLQLKCHDVHECPVNHTSCHDPHSTCVPNKWLCDGMDDCSNGADEQNCTVTAVECAGFLCHNFECIPNRWRCDGIPDCDDSTDEDDCPHVEKQHNCDKAHGFYQCMTGECISHLKVCDHKKDCPQGDDEGTECRPDGCHSMNCQHHCFVAPDGPQCYCRDGYDLNHKDNRTCVDKNECIANKQENYCSHTCINTDGGYKCSCHEGYQLKGNRTCVAKDTEPLLLFSNSDGIRGLYLRTNQYFPVYHALTQTVGIDYYGSEDRVYWVDLDKSHSGVYSVKLSGKDMKKVYTTALQSPEDLAIDWMGGNIYITDGELNKIIVCNIDGEICTSELFGILDLPRGIVVEPSEGRIFWSEWGRRPGIYTAGMDGSNKRHLINNQIIWPNGLALDSVANRLYWSEAKYGRIEFLDLDTNSRHIVIQDKVFHPFSLAVFEDSLYWSDWITYSLDMSNKFTGHNQTTLVREMNEHIMGVHVFHPLIQKLSFNPCLTHKCSHICVLAPSKGYSCVCPDHLELSKDSKNCVQPVTTPKPSTTSTTTTEKVLLRPVHKDVVPEVYIRHEEVHKYSEPIKSDKVNERSGKNMKSQSNTKDVTPEPTRHPENELFNSAEIDETDDSNQGWIALFVVVLIVSIIVLLITIIMKKDDYREVRNVLYSRSDQLKYAISLQNPMFRRVFRRELDEEEPLTEDDHKNADKY